MYHSWAFRIVIFFHFKVRISISQRSAIWLNSFSLNAGWNGCTQDVIQLNHKSCEMIADDLRELPQSTSRFVKLTLPKTAKTAVQFFTQVITRGFILWQLLTQQWIVFNDLDQFRDYCRFEGKVFSKQTYTKGCNQFGLLQKYQGWLRAKKLVTVARRFVQRERKPYTLLYNNNRG
jgi:hypothetical protein